MIKGRFGLPIHVGLNLFKVLIRVHMEFGIPVWANLSEENIQKLERLQFQSLHCIAGTKRNWSAKALNVILRTLPFCLLIQELCCREFIRISAKEESHIIQRLMNPTFRNGNVFSLTEYIKLKSRLPRTIFLFLRTYWREEALQPSTYSLIILETLTQEQENKNNWQKTHLRSSKAT